MKTNKETRYYSSFEDDFCTTRDQNMRLPDEYKRIKRDLPFRILSALTYGTALVISRIYLTLSLHVTYKSKIKIDGGAFIYCNHTQPVGDVFIPAFAAFPKRIYTVVSPANYAIPVIGKLLPYLGAIPIPSGIRDVRDFGDALRTRTDEGHSVVIFPEAHVWEYCSFIRDFPDTSFRYPVKTSKPAYALTVTYKPRRFGRKPKTEVYLDGPFYAPDLGTERERTSALRDTVLDTMKKRALTSASHIDYILKIT